MLKKFGINTTRAEKRGPNVKQGISEGSFKRVITCACGRKFEKSCPNEMACDITMFTCPHCGATIK